MKCKILKKKKSGAKREINIGKIITCSQDKNTKSGCPKVLCACLRGIKDLFPRFLIAKTKCKALIDIMIYSVRKINQKSHSYL